jgi:hypothetical protein
MPGLWDRLRNVLTDDLDERRTRDQAAYYAHLTEREKELAEQSTAAFNRAFGAGAAEHVEALTAERITGRTQLAELFAAELTIDQAKVRQDWLADISERHVPFDVAETYYRGKLDAYNDLAAAIHEQDNQGFTNLKVLPEIVHPEGIRGAVEQQAEQIRAEQDMAQEPGARHSAEVENAVLAALGSMASEAEMKHEEAVILSL